MEAHAHHPGLATTHAASARKSVNEWLRLFPGFGTFVEHDSFVTFEKALGRQAGPNSPVPVEVCR